MNHSIHSSNPSPSSFQADELCPALCFLSFSAEHFHFSRTLCECVQSVVCPCKIRIRKTRESPPKINKVKNKLHWPLEFNKRWRPCLFQPCKVWTFYACSTSTSQDLWLPTFSVISWDSQTHWNLKFLLSCLLCASWVEKNPVIGFLHKPEVFRESAFISGMLCFPCGETFKFQRSTESLRIHSLFHLANSRERVERQTLTVRRHNE